MNRPRPVPPDPTFDRANGVNRSVRTSSGEVPAFAISSITTTRSCPINLHGDGLATSAMLDGVPHEVRQQLQDAVRIAYSGRITGHSQLDRGIGFLEFADGRFGELAEIYELGAHGQ
jgi:hypothetical protein